MIDSRPVYTNQFYENPYRWWQFIKRLKWSRSRQIVGHLNMWSEESPPQEVEE